MHPVFAIAQRYSALHPDGVAPELVVHRLRACDQDTVHAIGGNDVGGVRILTPDAVVGHVIDPDAMHPVAGIRQGRVVGADVGGLDDVAPFVAQHQPAPCEADDRHSFDGAAASPDDQAVGRPSGVAAVELDQLIGTLGRPVHLDWFYDFW